MPADLSEGAIQLVKQGGLIGLALAMTAENLVQVIPSIPILLLAGHLSAHGIISLLAAVAASTAGSLIGCCIWYALGSLCSEERLQRLLRRHGSVAGLTPERLQASRRWFQRHGWKVVFWGRLVPILRTNVSLPAGIELMPWRDFLGWSLLGSAAWNGTLILVGHQLTERVS